MSRNREQSKQPPAKKLKRDDKPTDTGTKPGLPCQNKKEKSGSGISMPNIFEDHKIFILQAGIGKARTDLFKKQINSHGGTYQDSLRPDTSCIVVDEKMEIGRLCRLLKIDAPVEGVKIIKSLWLSNCLKEKRFVNTTDYLLDTLIKPVVNTDADKQTQEDQGKGDRSLSASTSTAGTEVDASKTSSQMYRPFKRKAPPEDASDVDSDYQPSGGEDDEMQELDELTAAFAPKRPLPKGNWACAQASSQRQINHNKHITDKLEALASIYEKTNDRWRALGYQKGIAALKRHKVKVSTYEEAKAIPGVGERLAKKIWEIIETGELRKLDELSSTEENQAIDIFTKIWGAGATTARQWVALGYRTLDDIRTKAKLTRHQQIGLKYYDDLNERMQRTEAGEIADTVMQEVATFDPALICMPCGSYRRGKETCGDVDVLITHPDGKSHNGIFTKIIDRLHQTGFLTDDLVTNEENGHQKKYMGVCKLPGQNSKHRRLDIIVVPYDEYACAVMYFTGSAHFNRSMRHLAGKMGMSLSEHSLNVGVVRSKGEKITKGTPLPTPTEESIFKHFGLPYRPPDQRNH